MKLFHISDKVMQIGSNSVHKMSVIQVNQQMTINAILEKQPIEIQK